MAHPYQIVVGYDFSELSDLALRSAFERAAHEPLAEVHVAHVMLVGDVIASGVDPATLSGILPPIREVERNFQARVAGVMAAWQAETGRTFSRLATHVRYEYPAREIAQLASDLEADLVVVGTHGRRGVNHFLMGSVAEGAVRLAPCPVLVVRPKATPPAVPAILPPCSQCLQARQDSGGAEYWCAQHRERHGQRHTYHYESRVGQTINAPLVLGNGR